MEHFVPALADFLRYFRNEIAEELSAVLWQEIVPVVLVQLVVFQSDCIWVDPINLDPRIPILLYPLNLMLDIIIELNLHRLLVLLIIVQLLARIKPEINRDDPAMLAHRLSQLPHALDADLVLLQANGSNVFVRE